MTHGYVIGFGVILLAELVTTVIKITCGHAIRADFGDWKYDKNSY